MDATTSSVVRHSEVESLKMPNATPRFSELTISKKPGITLYVALDETRDSISHLVSAVQREYRDRRAVSLPSDVTH